MSTESEPEAGTGRRGHVRSPEHVALGRTIRELRARRDLSQEQLGLYAGLHRNYVGAIERGEINPTFNLMLRLSAGLKLPLSEIYALYEQRREEYKPVRLRGPGKSTR